MHGAILGPFATPPFPLHTSPFLTKDKSSSNKKRVIVDLSWPKERSVNAAVPSDTYCGLEFVLKFPTIDNITQRVLACGANCYIGKIDISRAFKHIPIDPRDISYLGIYWGAYYIEKNLVFGFCQGSNIFQRTSDSTRYILSQEGHDCLNYLDDFLLIDNKNNCTTAFDRLAKLLPELGFTVSDHKTVKPKQIVTCLGIEIDTVKYTTSIPSEKLSEIKKLCSMWTHKKYCSK